MFKKPEDPTFWVTNISCMNVSLADLNLTVKALSSANLLDKRHYQYTIDQLTKSFESGSIFKKRDKIVIRKLAPEVLKMNVPFSRETFIPSRERSILTIKDEKYEELNVGEAEQDLINYAKENADTAHMDDIPLNMKKKA
jgi:hypothetical protein